MNYKLYPGLNLKNKFNPGYTCYTCWFASSKLCSCCGGKTESLALSVREWTCATCFTCHDRDINAAKNLEYLAVSSTVSACGASSDWAITTVIASHGALKQESSVIAIYG